MQNNNVLELASNLNIVQVRVTRDRQYVCLKLLGLELHVTRTVCVYVCMYVCMYEG